MIFSTQNQFNLFLFFLIFGFFCELIIQLFSVIFLKNYQKKLKIIIFDTVFSTFFAISFVFFIILLNFGKLSFSLILSALIGKFWCDKTNKKLFVFLENKWYNSRKQIKEKRKRKNEKLLHKN